MIDLSICVGRHPMAVNPNLFDPIDALALERIFSAFSSQRSHNTTQKSKNN
jgi:hypothetical protein